MVSRRARQKRDNAIAVKHDPTTGTRSSTACTAGRLRSVWRLALFAVAICSGLVGPLLWFWGLSYTEAVNAAFFGRADIVILIVLSHFLGILPKLDRSPGGNTNISIVHTDGKTHTVERLFASDHVSKAEPRTT